MNFHKLDEQTKKNFQSENEYKRMVKIHQYVASGYNSFSDMKKYREKRFQEICAKLRKETLERKKKRELKKSSKELSDEQ